MANPMLEVDGLSANQVYTELQKVGISPSDAAVMVAGWIYETLGKAKRTFNYQQTFPAAMPACVAHFNRTFVHQDWVDGENVVQAQQTAGEDGFNVRFHRIETDLDAVRTDLVAAFTCLAEMRSSLRALLDEVRAELNRLNNDVFTCCNKDEAGPAAVIPPLVKNPKFLGVTKFGEKPVTIWDTPQGTFVLPVPQTLTVSPVIDDRVRKIAELGRFLQERPVIRETFPNGFTKAELVGRFGRERTPDGRELGSLLEIMPDNTRFASVDALLDDLADREAAALRTTEGAAQAVGDAFGLSADIERVENTSVEKMRGVPVDARAALSRAGIATVGRLAAANPQEVARALEAQGVRGYSAGDIAEWNATAKVLAKVR